MFNGNPTEACGRYYEDGEVPKGKDKPNQNICCA